MFERQASFYAEGYAGLQGESNIISWIWPRPPVAERRSVGGNLQGMGDVLRSLSGNDGGHPNLHTHLRQTQRIAPAPSDVRSTAQPGWPEIIAGLLVLGVLGMLGGAAIARLPIGLIAIGLIFTALSGIAGMAGFLAAFLLRIRSWVAFGVRATSVRWMTIGAGVAVIAFIFKSLVLPRC